MKKKTSLINITKEEMKQTLAGGGAELAPIVRLMDASQPGHLCSAWCHCACYVGAGDGVSNWAIDGDNHAWNAYATYGWAVPHCED